MSRRNACVLLLGTCLAGFGLLDCGVAANEPFRVGVARVDITLSQPIPEAHQPHIDRYTRELTEHLQRVALAALADRQPARLEWSVGKVTFARNRRTAGGSGSTATASIWAATFRPNAWRAKAAT